MSKSVMTGEDSSWTQTFVTVTPQEDGFLREIEENAVISGAANTPINSDSRNFVLRRSLMNTTKIFINPAELEPLKRITAECQTYLQGVPKVELPLVYRDVATQTLYMKSDGQRTAAVKSIGDMITVMNKKALPELKMTRIVQTIITFEGESPSYDDLTVQLHSNINEAKHNDTKLIDQGTEKENADMEALDLLNFVIDRTLWMAEPESASKKEQKDVEVQTFIKYNNSTKKITIDNEVQTSLSCEPKHSNTMLLFEYKEAKNCCKSRIEECLEKGVYPRIMIDDMIDKIMIKCYDQINFPLQDEIATNFVEVSEVKRIAQPKEITCPIRKCPARCVGKVCPKLNPKTRKTEDILLADSPSYVVRTTSSAEADPNLKPSCPTLPKIPTASITTKSSRSFDGTSSSQSIEQISSESQRNLTIQDEEALGLLKSVFCYPETCSKR